MPFTDEEEGYCEKCNFIVAASNGLLQEHLSHNVGDYGQYLGKNCCPGTGEKAPADTPRGEVKSFAFRVSPDRQCAQVEQKKAHKAHEYRHAITYWCSGYEDPW